jgi:hypothetical protein
MAATIKYEVAKKQFVQEFAEIPFNLEDWQDVPLFINAVKEILLDHAEAKKVVKAPLDALREVIPHTFAKFLLTHKAKTIEEALDLLMERFGDKNVDLLVRERQELSRLVQSEGKSIVNFFTELEEAYMKAHPAADIKADGVQAELLGWLETKVLFQYAAEIERIKKKNPEVTCAEVLKHLQKRERLFLEWHGGIQMKGPDDPQLVAALNPSGTEYQRHLRKLEKEGEKEDKSKHETFWCWNCGNNYSHGTRHCSTLAT